MSEAAALQTPSAKTPVSKANLLLVQRKCACGGSAGLTGSCSDCEKKKLLGKPLQTKLRINEPGDEYEREADRVAEQVMRMAAPEKADDFVQTPSAPLVQRRVAGNSAGIGAAPQIVHEVLSSPGQPLDAATRAFFELRFGHDFASVRVHADDRAAASARAVGATAYTAGSHMVFTGASFAPQSVEGKQLLAHELAHVVQQGSAARVDRAPAESSLSRLPAENRGIGSIAIASTPLLQRACGRSIRAPEVCHATGGNITDFAAGSDDVYFFTRDCDDMEPGEAERLVNAARWRLSDGDAVSIHGFASEEGDPTFNQALSCARSNTAADLLRTRPLSITLYQHGATPGERTSRRSVVIEWPRPMPAQAPVSAPGKPCIKASDFLGPLAYLTADIAECLCGPVKFLDMFEDALAWIPGPVGAVFSADSVQTVISGADFLCNVLDFVQLAWQLGQGPDECWSQWNYSVGDATRLGALFGAMVIDAGAYPAGEKIGALMSDWLQTMIEELAAELVVSGTVAGQPEAVGAGLFLGFVVAPWVDALAQNVVEFGFDAGSYVLQNYLLAGTPFPLGTCRACARLGRNVKASVDESLCDRWNEAIPEGIRFPSLDKPSRGESI